MQKNFVIQTFLFKKIHLQSFPFCSNLKVLNKVRLPFNSPSWQLHRNRKATHSTHIPAAYLPATVHQQSLVDEVDDTYSTVFVTLLILPPSASPTYEFPGTGAPWGCARSGSSSLKHFELESEVPETVSWLSKRRAVVLWWEAEPCRRISRRLFDRTWTHPGIGVPGMSP